MKNSKGVTLISLIITIVVMMIIMNVMVYSSTTSLKIKNLNNMYSDIRVLEEQIAIHYLRYGELPITGLPISFGHSINENDGDKFYQVRIDILGGITLNNMREDFGDPNDIYIINTQSHTVYYQKGVSGSDGTVYYTIPVDYEEVKVDEYY